MRSARSAVECVERACDQIRTSDRLAHTLRAVLATGNTMNCGTHRGDASAIKLDSLAKMADVKVCCHFLTLLSIAVLHVLRQTGTPSCVGQCGVDMHILGMLSSFLFVCSMASSRWHCRWAECLKGLVVHPCHFLYHSLTQSSTTELVGCGCPDHQGVQAKPASQGL